MYSRNNRSTIFKALRMTGMASLVLLPVTLLAHHSNAMFDHSKTRVLKGKVDEFFYTNPHGYLQVLVTTSSGKAQNWTVEFQNVGQMERQGMSPQIFKPGDPVTVIVYPLKNGTTGGNFVGAILEDGRTLGNVEAAKASAD